MAVQVEYLKSVVVNGDFVVGVGSNVGFDFVVGSDIVKGGDLVDGTDRVTYSR